jgi:DNA-binding Lrp family transcriptional regulator
MARVRKEIINNRIYSGILFELVYKPLTCSEIARTLGKTQGIVNRQLEILEDKKYITRSEQKYKHNKIFYSVNWPKIYNDFFNQIIKFCKDNEVFLKSLPKGQASEIVSDEFYKSLKAIKDNKDKITKNPLVKESIRTTFNKKVFPTIQEAFSSLIRQISRLGVFVDIGYNVNQEPKENKELIYLGFHISVCSIYRLISGTEITRLFHQIMINLKSKNK